MAASGVVLAFAAHMSVWWLQLPALFAVASNSAACVFFRANILRLLVIADDILVLSVYDAYCGGVGKCRFYLFTRKYLVDSVATTLDWRKSG